MERTHRGQHGDDCGPCRWLSVGIAPSAMPSRHNNVAPINNVHNSWERGEARDPVTGMPLLDANLDPIGVHEYQTLRSRHEAGRRITTTSTPAAAG